MQNNCVYKTGAGSIPPCTRPFAIFPSAQSADIFLPAHVHPQRFRNADAAAGLQVVFEEGNQHTRRRNAGVVQRMREVFAAVVVMEQAGVKTDPVDANRLAPWPVDVLGGDQIISAILECTIDHLDISVDQPESAIRIA